VHLEKKKKKKKKKSMEEEPEFVPPAAPVQDEVDEEDAEMLEGEEEEQPKETLPPGPKRPTSAYLYFQSAVRQGIRDASEDKSNRVVLKKVAERWNAITDEEKAPYLDKHEEDVARFERELKAYVETHGVLPPKKYRRKNVVPKKGGEQKKRVREEKEEEKEFSVKQPRKAVPQKLEIKAEAEKEEEEVNDLAADDADDDVPDFSAALLNAGVIYDGSSQERRDVEAAIVRSVKKMDYGGGDMEEEEEGGGVVGEAVEPMDIEEDEKPEEDMKDIMF
jgi:hypothetical protein